MGDKDHIKKIIQVSILLLEMVLVVAIHIKEHQHMLEKEHPELLVQVLFLMIKA